MSLRSTLQDAQKEAMKAKDEMRLSTLRVLWSAVRNTEIDKQHELDDMEIQEVVARLVKQQRDAITDFQSGSRADLVEKAEKEIEILSSYLPKQLSDEELRAVIERVLADPNTKKENVGQVMGAVMKEVKGQADGNRVREMVTQMSA